MSRSLRPLIALAAVLATAAAGMAALGPIAAGSTSGTLESRIAASQAREGELHSGIGADTHQIEGFQGSIDDLQTRLDALESSLSVERSLLASLQVPAARRPRPPGLAPGPARARPAGACRPGDRLL